MRPFIHSPRTIAWTLFVACTCAAPLPHAPTGGRDGRAPDPTVVHESSASAQVAATVPLPLPAVRASASAPAPHSTEPAATVARPLAATSSPFQSLAPAPVQRDPAHPFGARPTPTAAIAASAHDTLLGAWNQGGNGNPTAPANRPGFHPATRVVLDTRVLSGKRSLGRLSSDAILAQTRNQGYWPFRLCLEHGIRAGTDERGKAVIRFSIDRRGRVTYARRMSSSFSSGVSDCMRKAAYTPRYQPGVPRRADVELVAEVSAGDVPLPSRDPVAPPFAEGALAAELDGLTPAVAECYRAGVSRDDALWGRLEMRLELAPDGTVAKASELASRFPDPEVTACATELFVGKRLTTAIRDLVVAFRFGSFTPP